MCRYNEAVYHILSDPVTPNEVVKKLGVTQKTAQRVLMHLALTRGDVKYKNSGRVRIFWKENLARNIGVSSIQNNRRGINTVKG